MRPPRVPLARAAVWLGLLVSAAFGYLAIRNARLADVWDALVTSEYGWMAPALAVMTAAFFLRALRRQLLFAPARRPPLRLVVSAVYVGYLFNNLLPARAGDAASVVALNRRARTPIAEAGGTLVVERVFDLLSLLVLLFLALPWLPHLSWAGSAGLLAGVLLLVIAVAVVALAAFGERPFAFAARHLARLAIIPGGRLETAPENLLHGLGGLRRFQTALIGFALTTLSWLVLAVGFWLLTIAFDLGLPPVAGLLVVIAVGLAMVLPSPPAALGVFEGATVLALASYDVADSRALSYALVLHALNALPFLVLAPLLLRPYRGMLSAARQPDAAALASAGSTRT